MTGTKVSETDDLELSWSGRWTLAHRILAVNILTLILLALSILYLDAFRNQLSQERIRHTQLAADYGDLLSQIAPASRAAALGAQRRASRPDAPSTRRRPLFADSWLTTGPTYIARPLPQKWTKDAARALDRGFMRCSRRSVDDFV